MVFENNQNKKLSKHQKSIISALIDITDGIKREDLIFTRNYLKEDMIEALKTTDKLYDKWLCRYNYHDDEALFNDVSAYIRYHENRMVKRFGLKEVFEWL